MKRKQKPIIQKIEFDEKTKEPITVQLKTDDQPISVAQDSAPVADSVSEKEYYQKGKQLVMKQVFGFEPKDSQIDKRKRRLKNTFVIVFAIMMIAVLAWTAYNDFFSGNETLPTWDKVAEIFSRTWKYLLYALGVLALTYLAKALKLSILCKSLTGKFKFWTCVETAIVGLYYNNVTPLAVGGQPFEVYHLAKHGVKGGHATSLPIATYFFNQLAYAILGLVAITTFTSNLLNVPTDMIGVIPHIVAILAYVGIAFSMLLPLMVILFSLKPKWGSKLVALVLYLGNKLRIIKKPKETTIKTYRTVIQNSRCLKRIATKPLQFILILILSFVEHLAGFSIAYFSLKFFGFDWSGFGSVGPIEWAQVVQLCVILSAAISFIPTPGNAGAADLSFYLLFKTGLGISLNGIKYGGFAFPAMATWRILSFYSYLIVGFIFTSIKRRADGKRERQKLARENGIDLTLAQGENVSLTLPPTNDKKE